MPGKPKPAEVLAPAKPADEEDLVAVWRTDPAFQRWVEAVCSRVGRACDLEQIKRDAGQPTNDLILGAELARKRMMAALVTELLRDPRTPKSRALAQMVRAEGRGFEMH